MLSRILTVIVALVLIGLGILFITVGHFGAILTGTSMCLLGSVLLIIIIWDVLEQKVNNLKGDAIEYQLSNDYWTKRELKELNAPDPNLIHPDDAKRDASYAEYLAEERRLDIKV